MSDLISRADAIAYIDRVTNSGLGRNKSLDYIHKYISSLPSAELPKGDLISRADAIEAVRKELVCDGRHETHDKTCRFIADVLLSALPSADAVQGEWKKTKLKDDMWICSACGSPLTTDDISEIHFCPNCGARMKGGAE